MLERWMRVESQGGRIGDIGEEAGRTGIQDPGRGAFPRGNVSSIHCCSEVLGTEN